MLNITQKIPIFKGVNIWRDIICSFIGRFNIVKRSIFSKWIFKFTIFSNKITTDIFEETYKLISKCFIEEQRTYHS